MRDPGLHSVRIQGLDDTKPSSLTDCLHACGKISCADFLSAAQKRSRFFHRLFNYKLMDFEYALWQMTYLFFYPQKVFRDSKYRNSSRSQWARDDPAFVLLFTSIVLVSSIFFALLLRFGSFQSFKFVLWVTFIDYLGIGLLVSTILWICVNKWLLRSAYVRSISARDSSDVEWGYCFDIHINAVFPAVLLIHVLQIPFVYTFISSLHPGSVAFGNLFWLLSAFYYCYITFLGYQTLPNVTGAHVFLVPVTFCTLAYFLAIYFRINLTMLLCQFYAARVG